MQEQLEKATHALEDTQERLHTQERSYGRKLTSITSEYERKINGLINHTGMSDLLLAAINRTTEGANANTTGGSELGMSEGVHWNEADKVRGGDGSVMQNKVGGAMDRRAGGGIGSGVGIMFGSSGGIDTTQDAMAKVLHERWQSEREKAKTLEARLKDADARMGDLEEVSVHRG